MTCRFRSSVSAASAASTWGIKVAWWKRGAWPSAMATAPWIPRTPIWGVGREVRGWRGGARRAGAGDQPAQPGDGFLVGGGAEQAGDGDRRPERHDGEAPVGLQGLDHRGSLPG